jgi:hypothetical protein
MGQLHSSSATLLVDRMSKMANPINILIDLEEKMRRGMPAESCESDINYKTVSYESPRGKHFIFAKVINSEVQAISVLEHENPFRGTERYSVLYAVRKNCRGRRLSVEAVNKGIAELSIVLKQKGISSFYVEALIDEKNIPSIKVAERLFPQPPFPTTDNETGTPAKLFHKLIKLAH